MSAKLAALLLAVAAALALGAGSAAAQTTECANPAPAALPLPQAQNALAVPAEPDPALGQHARDEAERMKALFRRFVLRKTLDRLGGYKQRAADKEEGKRLAMHISKLVKPSKSYVGFIEQDFRSRAATGSMDLSESQYFLYVDRNPSMQVAMVGFYDARTGDIVPIGFDLISTGNIKRGEDYYQTPTGVFENAVDNFGYRAEGTPNKEGWLGLGMKGSRVWDFGYTKSLKLYRDGRDTLSEMRLLIHSTDPIKGERRLGRVNSKGCIRISHSLNNFLDLYSIIDRNYEEWAKTKKSNWLLNKNRSPVLCPGRYMVIGDSTEANFPSQTRQATAGKADLHIN